MLGLKQEAMAYELGNNWTQKKISQLEDKETIDQETLELVAAYLHVTPEAIRKFNEESAVNFITNTFTDFKDNASASGMNKDCEINFNPLDKLLQSYAENKSLYERLLQSEKEKIVYLEQLAGIKKD